MKIEKLDVKKIPTNVELGYSMTAGIMPERIQEDVELGELTAQKGTPREELDYFYYFGANGVNFNQHIDITSHKFSLVYDLEAPQDIETVYISSMYHPNINYTMGEFEVYASLNREDLFEKKNRIIYYDNRNLQCYGAARNNADFLYKCEGLKARFVAYRQLNSNSPDMFSRIKNICFYGKTFTKQRTYLSESKLSSSCIMGIAANDDKALSGLTDEIVFDDFKAVELCDKLLNFKLKKPSKIDHIVLISKGKADFEVLFGEKAAELSITSENIEYDRVMYTVDIIDGEITDSITVKINGKAVVDQIIAYYNDRTVKLDTENIINEDFLGVGANVLPCHLFSDGRMRGFTEHYWELEKRRIAVAAPKIVRVWFQVDWFVMTEYGYLNREYCFDTPKMQAFYKELDAFKENNIEVELNFGWKISHEAQSWFSFPEVYKAENSAPKNLDAFATACSDCIRELIVNRGYDNIKYLTFYNEPNNGHINGGLDFACPDGYDLLAYWCEMLKKCDAQLKKDGLRHLIKIWAAESNSTDADRILWPDYFNKNGAEYYDYYCHHCYNGTYEQAMQRGEMFKKASDKHPFIISEFGVHGYGDVEGIDFSFERTNQNNVMAFMNAGMSGTLFWVLSGSPIVEHVFINSAEECFWQFMPVSGIDAVSKRFYELSLFTNYIPSHSKVIYSEVSDDGMHATAVKTPSGGYTVVVELSDSGKFDRTVNIDFDTEVNQKFYKHCYRLGCKRDANMIIPPVEKEIEVGSALTDKVEGSYSLLFYTTEPPKPQVVMEKCEVFVKPGESIKLNASVIDGQGELVWSMPDCYSDLGFAGTVTPDGVYTACDRFFDESMHGGIKTDFAVKAELPTGEYGIVIVKVRKYTLI